MDIPLVVKITVVILLNVLGIVYTTYLFLAFKDMSSNKDYIVSVKTDAQGATNVPDNTYIYTENSTKITFLKVTSILFLYIFTKNILSKLNILAILNVLISFGLLFIIITLFASNKIIDNTYTVELDSIRYNYILLTCILMFFMFSLNILIITGSLSGVDVEQYIGISQKIIPDELRIEPTIPIVFPPLEQPLEVRPLPPPLPPRS